MCVCVSVCVCVCVCEQDLELNNKQILISHKTQQTNGISITNSVLLQGWLWH